MMSRRPLLFLSCRSWGYPEICLVACLRQRGDRLEPAHDGGPVAHGSLPFVEVLAAHITAVDDLITVGYGNSPFAYTHGSWVNFRQGKQLQPFRFDKSSIPKQKRCHHSNVISDWSSPWTRSLGTFSGARESTSSAGTRPGDLKIPSRLSGRVPADFALQVFFGVTPEESEKPRRTLHRPARFHLLGKSPSQAACPRAGLSPGRTGGALSRRVPST